MKICYTIKSNHLFPAHRYMHNLSNWNGLNTSLPHPSITWLLVSIRSTYSLVTTYSHVNVLITYTENDKPSTAYGCGKFPPTSLPFMGMPKRVHVKSKLLLAWITSFICTLLGDSQLRPRHLLSSINTCMCHCHKKKVTWGKHYGPCKNFK